MKEKAFSLIEIIFIITILSVLFGVANQAFRGKSAEKEIETIANTLVSDLEMAKTNSITGKSGQNYGLKFNSDSYVYFVGSSYIESNENNVVTQIPSNIEIINDIPGSTDQIIFSKITGDTNHDDEISISVQLINDPSKKVDIIIGELGDISMIK
jgi:type II secretory pathway pseudopilin PulG